MVRTIKPTADYGIGWCPYTYVSLQFFLTLPLVKMVKYLNFAPMIAYSIGLTVPSVLFHLAVALYGEDRLTKVRHLYSSRIVVPISSDHPHDTVTSSKVAIFSLALSMLALVGYGLIEKSHPEQSHLVSLGFYLMLLAWFHFTEYLVTSITNPSTLSPESFLLTQSSAYNIAILTSVVEFIIESALFPEYKRFGIISAIGLLISFWGDCVRKLAMFTAGKNFSHVIAQTKSPGHKLVTHGIYSIFRHPSYTGWFYWALGSQLLLMNPVCFILFFIISYRFFKERIMFEERTLIDFFANDYINYREKVGTWLPIKLDLS